MQKDRPEHPGPLYLMHAVEQLALDFPLIPKLHVRGRLNENKGFYVPTYYVLLADETSPTPPYTRKRTASKQANRQKHVNDEAFDREHGWLIVKLDNERVAKDAEEAERIADEEAIAAGEGVECGCCFAEYPIHKMAQCPEAHLFCTICLGSYASNLLGEHNPALRCMDQSGCTALFSEDTLSCVLTPKLMELYHRVKQRKEIEAAGLEGLEECPFCEYKCVIENPEEKLFRCERRECGAVSCRGCQKLDHVPRSCKEMEEDKHLNARHTVEEAMTAALMRNCPKCNKAFIKEMGCNKMTCPDCRTISCYTCREVIRGYDHFSNGKKCNLWDSLDGTAGPDRRHEAEVAAAREKALEQYRKDHPDADAHELKAVEVQLAVPGGSKNAGRSGVHQRVPQAAQGMQHVGQRIRDAEHLMQEAMQQAEQRLQQAEQRIRQARRERQQQQLVQNAAGVPMVGLRPEFLRGAGVNMDFGELGAGGGLNFGMNWGAAVPPPVAPHLPIFDHPFAPPPPPMNGAAYMERLGIFPPAGGQGLRDGQAHAPAHAVHRRGRGNHNRRRQNR
ncbi:hypothetical protein CONPUDRAFT_107947 [Coniophora puteana RWD-64-598 SS2]|uniref:RING-type domain-containing protein n=1 Tax=Coniophora puteana (strain RWD-64-598) TaxID=741705 RepID=A0A5M3MFZ4_CONPW|nr:uncharacterized protein CONPUDRAFT_107947 [Coniophora puteana RWD-64-598 SS2]EIW78179.1 hypothetical protein CONPUDRAFT_107947 [Coniophora puteana RWD-64-598 SS2]